MPADLYGRIAERLIFPAMAQVQRDESRLQRAFLRGLALAAVIGMPLLAILAPEVIDVVFEPRWHADIAPFAVLSIATYSRLGAKLSGSLQRAKGAVRAMVTNQIVYSDMVVGACLFAFRGGIVVVALAVSIGVFAFDRVINVNACRLIDVRCGETLRVHAHGPLLASVMELATAAVVLPLRTASVPPPLSILITSVALVLFGTASLATRPRWLLDDSAGELTDDVARWLERKCRSASQPQ